MNLIDYYITPEEYEIAEKNGIHKETLNSRVRDFFWDKQTAITKPPRKKNSFGKWTKVARKNGIKYSTFTERIYKGWTPEKAATTKVMDKADCIRKMHEVRGII